MAALNFPDPAVTQTYTEAGITWTWNATLGVWSSDGVPADADDLYLSKVHNDTAAGEITFEGQTTHEAGIITNTIVSDTKATPNTVLEVSENDSANVAIKVNTSIDGSTQSHGLFVGYNDAVTDHNKPYLNINSKLQENVTSTNNVYIVAASEPEPQTTSGNVYGLYSGIRNSSNNGTGNAYQVYAGGDAKSQFNGDIRISSEPDSVHHFTALSDIGRAILQVTGANTGSYNPITVIRANDSAANSWTGIIFKKASSTGSSQTETGKITIGGTFARTIDTRLGATGVAMADGAADIVKALQPKVITQDGETFAGFLPEDLAETYADAMEGEAGATVAVGTYTDPEGNVQTDVEEPQAIPYGATWQQTGTQDVMQSVCRENLIPVLTKALQEALARIEELESNTLQPVYATLADLPDASEHHGKTAHVHAEGALYFAHAGNWVKLQNA